MVDSVRYYISYQSEATDIPMATTIYTYTPGGSGGSDVEQDQRTYYVLTSLTRDTEYAIQIRVQLEYSPCSTYVSGNYSDSVSFRTNATSRSKCNYNIIIIANYIMSRKERE